MEEFNMSNTFRTLATALLNLCPEDQKVLLDVLDIINPTEDNVDVAEVSVELETLEEVVVETIEEVVLAATEEVVVETIEVNYDNIGQFVSNDGIGTIEIVEAIDVTSTKVGEEGVGNVVVDKNVELEDEFALSEKPKRCMQRK